MNTITIIHNPRCSKSREALKIIEERGISPVVIEYLNGELSRELLEKVIKSLGVHPQEILRTKEEEFQALSLNLENAEEVITAIMQHPKILERPIVMKGNQAVIGRPPEKVLELF